MIARVLGGGRKGEGRSPRAESLKYSQNDSCGWCLNRISTSTFGMLFSSPAEADNARRILTQRTQLLWPVQRELYINCHMLLLSVLKGAGTREGWWAVTSLGPGGAIKEG